MFKNVRTRWALLALLAIALSRRSYAQVGRDHAGQPAPVEEAAPAEEAALPKKLRLLKRLRPPKRRLLLSWQDPILIRIR